MPRARTFETLADLAEEQWGLFTRRQAQATGMAWSTLSRFERDGGAERVASGVYRLRGVPADDLTDLRAAWLQLAPDTPVWQRTGDQGVVSHRSAAMLYGFGHLDADVHQFTFSVRRQSRRRDVQMFRGHLDAGVTADRGGLLVTRPPRIAADLLAAREDAQAVAYVISEAIAAAEAEPQAIADAVAPYAAAFGLDSGDGRALLSWLLDLVGDQGPGSAG